MRARTAARRAAVVRRPLARRGGRRRRRSARRRRGRSPPMKTATRGDPQPTAAPTEYPAQTRPSRIRERVPVEPTADLGENRAPSALTGGLPGPGRAVGPLRPALARTAAPPPAPGRARTRRKRLCGAGIRPSAGTVLGRRGRPRPLARPRRIVSPWLHRPSPPRVPVLPPRRPLHGAAPRIGRYTRSVTQGHSLSTLSNESRGERHCAHPDRPVAWLPEAVQPVVRTTFSTGSPAAKRVSCAASSRLARGSNAEVLPPT